VWWEPILNQPMDKYIFGIILLGTMISGRAPFVGKTIASTQGKAILLYIAACGLSILFNGVMYSFTEQISILLKLFAVFIAFSAFIDTPDKMKWLMLSVVITTAMVAYQGILLKNDGVGWAGQTKYWGDRICWAGMYNGANVLCMLFDIAMAFVIHLVFGPWDIVTKIIAAVCGGYIVNGIYLTNSRGGFLSFLVVIGMYFLLKNKETLQKIKLYKLVGIGIVMFGLLMFGPSRMDKMNDDDHSAAGRIDAWQEGIEMVREHPLFGIGKGQWLNYHFRLAHNSIVQTMGENGVLGLFAWFAMLYISLRNLFTLAMRLENGSKERNLTTAVICAFMGYLSASFFITTTQFDLPYIFFGMTLSLVWRSQYVPTFEKKDFKNVGIITVASMIVIYATVRIFYM
jgi:O-antigen ligase